MKHATQSRIVKVLEVVDTREFVEDGDRWIPVPGSGTEHACDRCGRTHEVHALVELADKSTAVVGSGCMKAESVEVQKALRSGASRAKTLARLKAELAGWKAKLTLAEQARAEVRALPYPAVQGPFLSPSGSMLIFEMDGAQVWQAPRDGQAITAERLDCLRQGWTENYLVSRRGWNSEARCKDRIGDIEKRILRLSRV